MLNVMAALSNIVGTGALCESSVIPFLVPRRKVWLISAIDRPKFAILCGHAEEILLFNKLFSDCQCMP